MAAPPIARVTASAQGLGRAPECNPQSFARHERKTGEARDLIIGGTERRRQRPKNKAKRDELYSGHKHQHADKNVVITNRHTKRIGFLSQTYPGNRQDKKIADSERISYPCHTRLGKDTGFQGYEPRGVATYQPKKSRAVGR